MTDQEAAPILLVRSIEEVDGKTFPPSTLSEALTAAAGDLQPSSWFFARARHLLHSVPHSYSAILRMAKLPEGWTIALCAVAFLLGLATNYLGPVEKIPILLNPIIALVAWNLLLYLVLALWWLRSRLRAAKRVAPGRHEKRAAGEQAAAAAGSATPAGRAPWIARVLLPSVWIFLHDFTLRFHATRKQAISFAHVARNFWVQWIEAARPLLLARWRRLSHGAAIALAAGAIAGMYVRGIFLRYDVIWSSTFVTDENSVARWIEIVFAPAIWVSRLLGRDLGAEIEITRLMSPEGAPAAPWIHLFVLTALVWIVIPRSLLAVAQSISIRRAKSDIRIDFDDYFARLIRPQIEALITQEIEQAVGDFADAMAAFVRERLYDGRIVPEITRFRAGGGKISDLKRRIHESCEQSREEINAFARAQLKALEGAIAPSVERALSAVQRHFRLDLSQEVLGDFSLMPENEFDRSVRPIGTTFTDAIGAGVSASVAVAVGTIAGGFGESLEIAIIVALFGTTGPVGFLIGALIGLLAGAAAWWWGRDKVTEQIENIPLPGKLVSAVLWPSRFDKLVEQGREKCDETVRARVRELLSPLSARICADVWAKFGELWSEKSRRARQK